jgi:hypothetical protein
MRVSRVAELFLSNPFFAKKDVEKLIDDRNLADTPAKDYGFL